MAVTCTENVDSQEFESGRSATLRYTIRGTASTSAAITALLGEAPSTYGGLFRQPPRVEPVSIDTDDPDTCIWLGTVEYATAEWQDPPEAGDSSFSFDTGGGTQHITQSLATVHSYPSGTAPDHQGAIGATESGVDGVDITVPVYSFSETHFFAPETVDSTYKGKLFALTGKVNSASFRGLAAGECLFLGASGSRRGTGSDDLWELTFKFAGSPNRTGMSVGSISGIAKEGWEYLWVRYEDEVDDTAKTMVKRPVAVYVEKVYESGNFSDLGLDD